MAEHIRHNQPVKQKPHHNRKDGFEVHLCVGVLGKVVGIKVVIHPSTKILDKVIFHCVTFEAYSLRRSHTF